MKDYLRYMLYSTICIVTVIVALIFFEWFTSKPYTMESFATQAPYMILVGVTAGGEVYYADVDVPIQPKWIRAATLTGIGDIAGSYGMLYTTTTAGSVPKYGAYDSTKWANMPSGTANNITVDDRGTVAGINGTRITVSPRNTTGFTETSSSAISLSISQGEAYCVGTDNKLYYSANPASSSWTLIDAGTTWKQVSLDSGVVCAIKTDGTLWCADSNIGAPTTGTTTTVGTGSSAVSLRSAANFTQQGGSSRLFDSICVKGGRLIGIGKDGKIYYSDSYKNPTWKDLSALSKVYILSTGIASTDPVPVFTKVIMMYPSATARKKRFIGTASACNANEQRIGIFCYQACPSGKPASGTQCPYLAKTIPAIATCPLDTSPGAGSGAQTQYANGSCYQKCPDEYQPSADGISCIGIPIQKSRKSLNTGVTPSQQLCPQDGSVAARYIRVRPSPLLKNNKLCIKSFSIGLGVNEGSGGSTRYTVTATDGSGKEAPIISGSPDKYLCGNTFDKDVDGGQNNRASKLYWQVDLGSIRNIKTITFTGCNYINEGGNDTGVSAQPGADQITGMIIDLYKTNPTSATPVATRTLGSSKTQTITFNYVQQNAEMPNRCYDSCPPINGVPSARLNDYTCMAASGGVTKRAISSPILLGPASCTQAIAGDGTPRVYSATTTGGASVNIERFVPDPNNNQYILSCDGLPGSVLKPLSTSVSWPAITTTSLSENFAPDNTVYVYYQSTVTQRKAYLRFRTRMKNWLLDKQWKYLPRTDSTPTTKNVTWENASGTAYTSSETPYLCVIEPTANTTYTIGGAANVEYKYNSVYNSYIIDTAKTYSDIVNVNTLNSYLSDVCSPYEYRTNTSKRQKRYCPIPATSTEKYEDIWMYTQIGNLGGAPDCPSMTDVNDLPTPSPISSHCNVGTLSDGEVFESGGDMS